MMRYFFPGIVIALFLGLSSVSFSQNDTEFWFVVPELSHRGNTGGTPATMRIATLELAATVTISMPANPYDPILNPTGFQDTVFDIAGNSTAAIDLSHLIDIAVNPANDRIENKALTWNGVNDFGLYITATNMINVYWEINYDFGADLWTLKGQNGLGTLFYTPFQTVYNNRGLIPRTYSAIDVVSSEDNNQVTFTLPPGIAASYGALQIGVPAGGTHTVTLDRGQTFSLYPRNYSILAADRLAGTRITSTARIAVTVKDDAIASGSQGQDVVGDQIVPVDIVGSHYIVPEINNPNHVYVIATQDNTPIYVFDPDGLPIGPSPYVTLNTGEQALVIVPGGSKYARLTSQLNPGDPPRPFYVYQMGIENQSRGGAIIPPIGCTGNTQLAFTRARSDNKFYFFIIVETGNEDKFLIDGVRDDGIIDPGAFTVMLGSGGYSVLFSNSINSNILTVGQHLVENTGGIFHLGILNGFPGAAQGRLYYGYYSDFGGLNIGATVAGTNSSVVRACYGSDVQLYAFGGTQYLWTPSTYLDDPTSNLPTAYNLPPGAHNYTVEVSGACQTGTVDLTVLVSQPVQAFFETNVTSGCSPLSIQIDDQSTGTYSWQYDLGDGSPLIRYDLNPATPYPEPPGYPAPFSIPVLYTNTTNAPIEYNITLLAKNSSDCSDILTKTIVVFPEITSDFTQDIDDGCDPLTVQFQNNSSGNTDTWLWEYGDGASSIQQDPQHTFRNLFGPDNLVFNTRLVAISPYNCRDTSYHNITVRPYIEANFAFDTVMACTPHDIIITDQSIGADFYSWNFGDGNTSNSSGPVLSHTYVNNNPVPDTFTISLRVDNEEGCFDSIAREVVVFPEINAAFTAAPDEGCSPFEVIFQNNSSGAASYFWDFGDGGTSTEANPIHLYDRNMMDHDTTYRVTLVATSNELCRDTAILDILIHPYIEAAFTVEDIVGCHPFTITIDNQSIGVDQYFWNFGDGSPISNTSAASFNHTYSNTGNSTLDFNLQLIVLNNQGCRDTLVRVITVHPEMTANFTVDNNQDCHPLTVTFTDLSLNAITYYWDFGDGASSLLPSPVHTFNNFGTSDTTYLVTLTTSSADGECVKSVSWPITVHAQVQAEFTFPDAFGCSPFAVDFENLSNGGSDHTWDFGDGTVLSTPNPDPVSHTFVNSTANTIDYPVTLTVENYAGCTAEVIKTLSVYPVVQSGFTRTPSEGCHPVEVEFTNESTGALTYVWEFGDGSYSNQTDPTHTYSNTGTVDSVYSVKLLAIAPNHVCRDSVILDITVHPYLLANFTISDQLGCNPFDVVLGNSSVNASIFRWDFGDGTDTITNDLNAVTHRFINNDFSNQQDYEITLVAENFAGCTSEIRRTITVEPDISAGFSASQDEDCHPFPVDFTNSSSGAAYYYWDFGDGTNSSQVNPSRTFTNTGSADSTYTVWLYTTASNNVCRDSISMDIIVHPYISANFTVSDPLGCSPFDAVFENASINASTFNWDFGDGTDTITSNTNPLVHRFSNSNFSSQQDFEITLTAENAAGCSRVIKRTITVEPAISAGFTVSQDSGCHIHTVDFTNTSGGAAYYSWDFGQGTSSQLTNPSQDFTNIGASDTTYQVWLHATASNNVCRDSQSVNIVVHPYIRADFTFQESIQCSPSSVRFNNASNGGETFTWDFGDGSDTITTSLNPLDHIFNNSSFSANGTFQVRLTAENAAGCNDQITKNVEVYPDIEALFNASVDEGCHPLEVDFSNLSNGGFTYLWDFGDGGSSDADDPSHSFTNFTDSSITRQVLLRATSRYNCTSEISANITIHPRPRARYITDRIIDCPPFDLPLTNTSINADNYTWIFGDGDSLETNSMAFVNHVYDNQTDAIATYELKLIASTTYNCIDSSQQKIYVYPRAIADFSSNREGCSPLTVYFTNESTRGESYLWDFGDGTSMAVQDPTNIYFNTSGNDTIYLVNLITTTEYGCTDTISDTIFVYLQPEAEFTASPTHQDFPSSTVSLTNMTNPGTWTYLWDWDDGATASDQDPQPHTYADWGDYEISLYVSSARCVDSVSHTIRIFPAPPVALFDTIYPDCAPHAVQFNNSSLYSDSVLWEFDDGYTSTDLEPSHTFDEPGVYNVKLTVFGEGGIDYAYHQVAVYRNPVADFTYAPDTVMLPDEIVKFYNQSEHADYYLWDFGDGNTSSEEDPVHQYTEMGTYTITLDATTVNGCTDRLVMPDAVNVIGTGIIIFPNAFKPDMNGPNGGYYDLRTPYTNHIFHPYWEGVVEYNLTIYSRWGELLYTSDEVMKGWDGYVGDLLSREDVYIWKCSGVFINGRKFNLAGDVTLMHHLR